MEIIKAFIGAPKFQQQFKAQKLCILHSVALKTWISVKLRNSNEPAQTQLRR